MKKRNKSMCIILIVLILFGVSVGYAAISRTLTINGNSEVKENSWNIYFDNIKITEGSVTATRDAVINNSSIDFSIRLDLPGDFYEFTVDVINDGSIDAMIDSSAKTPELTSSQSKYLNYIIEYQNGEQIISKQLVKSKEDVRIKVRVEYRSDITETDLPSVTENINLGFGANFIQADSSGVEVKGNGKVLIRNYGSLDIIGTVVSIGTE